MGIDSTIIPTTLNLATEVDDDTIEYAGSELKLKDNGVTLAKLKGGTIGKYIGFDGSGDPAELDAVTSNNYGVIHLTDTDATEYSHTGDTTATVVRTYTLTPPSTDSILIGFKIGANMKISDEIKTGTMTCVLNSFYQDKHWLNESVETATPITAVALANYGTGATTYFPIYFNYSVPNNVTLMTGKASYTMQLKLTISDVAQTVYLKDIIVDFYWLEPAEASTGGGSIS